MRNRLFVGVAGIVFALVVCAPGARGLSAPRSAPRSVPVAVSVFGGARATGFGHRETRQGTEYVGVNVSRSLVDHSENNYFAYVSVCEPDYCTSWTSAFGATKRGDFTWKPGSHSLRFRTESSCGLIDVTFSRTSKPTLYGGHGLDQNGVRLMSAWFNRSLGATASAVGRVCGHQLNSSNGSLDVWTGASVQLGKQTTGTLPR